MIDTNCLECGKQFKAQRSTAKFCSPTCRVKFHNRTPEIEAQVAAESKPKIETKQTVVTPKGELKQVPSKKATDKLQKVRDELNKRFGAGTIMRLGDKAQEGYDVISSGSIGLDAAMGIGGFPRGRIIELMGWESSGKTTLAINAVADAQKQKLKCLWIDAENAFDSEYAEALGVNTDEMEYVQPSSGEEALSVAEHYISSGEVGLVVFDSVAALVPRAELEGDMGDSKLGLHARLMSQACRKLVGMIARTNTLVIFINQLRHKIGIAYGSPDVPTGGNALKFYATMRLDISRSTTKDNSVMDEDGNKEGNLTTVKVIKNKVAPPFRSAQFTILYGKGIDRVEEVSAIAIKTGVIKKEGNTYSYDGTKIGVGFDATKEFLSNNLELCDKIESEIRNQITHKG